MDNCQKISPKEMDLVNGQETEEKVNTCASHDVFSFNFIYLFIFFLVFLDLDKA